MVSRASSDNIAEERCWVVHHQIPHLNDPAVACFCPLEKSELLGDPVGNALFSSLTLSAIRRFRTSKQVNLATLKLLSVQSKRANRVCVSFLASRSLSRLPLLNMSVVQPESGLVLIAGDGPLSDLMEMPSPLHVLLEKTQR